MNRRTLFKILFGLVALPKTTIARPVVDYSEVEKFITVMGTHVRKAGAGATRAWASEAFRDKYISYCVDERIPINVTRLLGGSKAYIMHWGVPVELRSEGFPGWLVMTNGYGYDRSESE